MTRETDIRARAEKATKGPWTARDQNSLGSREGYWIEANHPEVAEVSIANVRRGCGEAEDLGNDADDADFIAHAREDIPWLLGERAADREKIAALESEIARLRAELDATHRDLDECQAQNEALKSELEKAQGGREDDSVALGNLLAIIHRDGGHYQATYGTAKAVADAHQVWAKLMDSQPSAPAPGLAQATALWGNGWLTSILERVAKEQMLVKEADVAITTAVMASLKRFGQPDLAPLPEGLPPELFNRFPIQDHDKLHDAWRELRIHFGTTTPAGVVKKWSEDAVLVSGLSLVYRQSRVGIDRRLMAVLDALQSRLGVLNDGT
jgi:hypothetical protein